MKTKLVLKSLSDLPSPSPETAPSSGYALDLNLCTTDSRESARGRWDSKEPIGNSLTSVLGRMAPPQLHVN